MSRSHSSTVARSLSALEYPRCPHCQARMVLESISPAPPGYDLRTFACNTCERISTRLVVSDPIKSEDVLRWLEGDPKRPD